ncbi:MAG: TolC family protein [Cytophagales bacterium]|nr:TolC family protein [Cytophagales bacterium]
MRSIKRLALSVGLLGFFLAPAYAQQTLSMGLEDCIEYALEYHSEVKNKQLDAYNAKAKVGETRSAGLPQLNFNMAMNGNPNIQPAVFPNEKGTPFYDKDAGDKLVIPFGVAYDGSARFSASQLLFDGSYIVGLMAARTYRELADKELVQTRIDRVEAVKKAFYLVLVNQKSLASFESNVNRLRKLAEETEAMLEQGLVDETDLDRLKVNYNNSLSQRNNAARGLELSYWLLKYHMAMPQDCELSLEGEFSEAAIVDESDLLTDDFDFSDRVEIQLLQVNADLAKLSLRQYQVQYLPKLELVAGAGYSSGANSLGKLLGERWYWSSVVGMKLTMPIFDGLRKHYQIRQARFGQEKISNQKEFLEQGITVEIQQARNALLDNKETLEVSRQNMKLAEKVFTRTKAKYQAGLGSNLEVVQADDDFRQAETVYFNSLYQAILARISLEKATGKLYK